LVSLIIRFRDLYSTLLGQYVCDDQAIRVCINYICSFAEIRFISNTRKCVTLYKRFVSQENCRLEIQAGRIVRLTTFDLRLRCHFWVSHCRASLDNIISAKDSNSCYLPLRDQPQICKHKPWTDLRKLNDLVFPVDGHAGAYSFHTYSLIESRDNNITYVIIASHAFRHLCDIFRIW